MLEARWQKVLIDLWRNRSRTLVVALAIAVGVYAVGVVVNTRQILVREYRSDQVGALPAAAILHTQAFDDDLAERLARVPGVAAAEGRSLARARTVDRQGREVDLVLVAVPDFERMQVDALTPLTGRWPTGRREMVLERLAADFLAASGGSLQVELDDGTTRSLEVVGTVHDAQEVSPDITDTAFGYVTPATMDSLGLPSEHTELRLRVVGTAQQTRNEAYIRAVVDRVEKELEQSGRPVLSQTLVTESKADPFIDTVVLILTAFGLIILLLSGFLVVNAMSALITQQIPQIGVMKLVGARRSQIVGLYLVTVLVYGVLAVSVALPLAMLTARLLMTAMVNGLLNVLPESYAVPLPLLLGQAAVGLLLPLVAGLAPVLRGTGITTQRALSDVGLSSGRYGHGLVDRLLAAVQKVRVVERPVLLALRNTLRHKGRLVQTLIVLTLGTALFISVMSTRASINATLEGFMRFHDYDVSLELEQPQRVARVEQAVRQNPGVVDVEVWSSGRVLLKGADGRESDPFSIYAVPAGSTFLDPQVLAGRWLPDAADAARPVVVNSDVLDDHPEVGVGSAITLEIDGRESVWQVVGVVPTESRGPAAYVGREDYAYASRTAGQGTLVQVRGRGHDGAAQHELATLLQQRLDDQGLKVRGAETTQSLRAGNALLFTIVVAFLILMALLLAAVGGLGLTTTMSINILERVREIGILRAIGASNASVRQIVLAEGVVMGLVSWGVGTLLSLVLSPFFSEQLGLALLQVPLIYHYSIAAAVGWFFVLQAIAVGASLGPARNAARLTVREVLAYE
jgi:putative ABC transport system permease protein